MYIFGKRWWQLSEPCFTLEKVAATGGVGPELDQHRVPASSKNGPSGPTAMARVGSLGVGGASVVLLGTAGSDVAGVAKSRSLECSGGDASLVGVTGEEGLHSGDVGFCAELFR